MSFRNYKWRPNKQQKADFKEKMQEIAEFCNENNIIASSSNDSYYFTINNQKYRVSNHTVENSNSHAFDSITFEQKRPLYHEKGREEDTIYITASKTRLIEIYNDLAAGYKLDKRGNKIKN